MEKTPRYETIKYKIIKGLKELFYSLTGKTTQINYHENSNMLTIRTLFPCYRKTYIKGGVKVDIKVITTTIQNFFGVSDFKVKYKTLYTKKGYDHIQIVFYYKISITELENWYALMRIKGII